MRRTPPRRAPAAPSCRSSSWHSPWPRNVTPARPGGLQHDPSKMAAVLVLLAVDAEQLDLEDQRGAARDGRRVSMVAIGDVRGADQLRLLADVQLLHALGPALDHAVERELRRLAPLVGGIEDGAVDQPALVVDLDLVGLLRARALAGAQHLDHQPGGRLLRALLLRRLGEEVLGGGLLLLGGRVGARLHQLGDRLLPLRRLRLRLGPGGGVVEPLLHHLQLAGLELQGLHAGADADSVTDRIEGLVVVALERLRAGGEREGEQGGDGEPGHGSPFVRRALMSRARRGVSGQSPPIPWVMATSSVPASGFAGSSRSPPTKMVPPRWML